MFGLLRSSATRIASNVRLLQLPKMLSIPGQQAQSMFVKAGMEIPDNKRLEFALQYIHGIGRSRARQILADISLDNKLAKDLTQREIFILGEELSKYAIGIELRTYVDRDLKRLSDIQSYRGIRHADALPCRGQRTKTNARTRKAQGVPYILKQR